MILADKYEVPDHCPDNCPHRGQPFDMCGPCFRCPILNCSPIFDEDGNDMTPLPAEHFHPDLAEEWHEFFEELNNDRREAQESDKKL